jgi:hypothetical protein
MRNVHNRLLALRQTVAKLPAYRYEQLLIALLAVVFFVSLVSAHIVRPYTSDDTATQTILQSWEDGQYRSGVVGENNYIIKVPFFLAQDLLQSSDSRLKLFTSILAFNAILFVGLIAFLRAIVPADVRHSKLRLSLAYLPLGWTLSLFILPILQPWDVSRMTAFMNPNYRNAEIGLALLFVLLFFRVSAYTTAAFKRPRLIATSVFGLLGFSLLMCSDPYFVYVFTLPLILLLAIQWVQGVRTLLRSICMMGCLLAAIIGSFVFKALCATLGLYSIGNIPRQFIASDAILTSLTNTISAEFKQFSADIFGQVANIHLLPQLANVILIGICVGAFIITLKRSVQLRDYRLFIVLVIVGNFILYMITTNNAPTNDRYIFITIFLQAILAGSILAGVKNKRLAYLFILVMFMGLCINAASNILVASKQVVHGRHANAINRQIIDVIHTEGYAKGYASYWDANINTYLSSDKTIFLPVVCGNGQASYFRWVINQAAFSEPAQKSFYVYVKNQNWSSLTSCDSRAIQKQTGHLPIKTVTINDSYDIYFYDVDIGKNINH